MAARPFDIAWPGVDGLAEAGPEIISQPTCLENGTTASNSSTWCDQVLRNELMICNLRAERTDCQYLTPGSARSSASELHARYRALAGFANLAPALQCRWPALATI